MSVSAALPHEEAVHGVVGEPRLHAEDMRKMALRIEVDAQRPRLALGDGGEQVECGRGLADAALLVEDCDDRHAAEDTLSSAGPSPRLCKRVAKAAPETAPRALAYHLALSYDLPAQRRDPRRRAGQAHAFGAAESLAPAGRPAARRPCPGRRAHAFPARDRRRHRFRRRCRAGRDRRAPTSASCAQDPPKGTGDATRVALDALPADGVTLVTIGDIPLVPPAALAALVREAQAGRLAVLTARVPDPSGLGRIVRDDTGAVRAIVEEKDADPAQRALRRDQHRRDGRTDGAAASLGRRAQAGQCAEGVLPDRHRRARGGGRDAGRRPRGGRRARRARHQRSRPIGGGRAHRSDAAVRTR